MATRDSISPTTPLWSIVIGVYNDWVPLNACLRSLTQQANAPNFEVIVVDDGSSEPTPDYIQQWVQSYPLTIVRQPHAGISVARNRGVQESKGSALLFVDADCRFEKDCLVALDSAINNSPQHDFFQLHLVGDCSQFVGRAEQLRLETFQNHMLQPNGCIRYLNTAGFALRRTRVDFDQGVFDPIAIRAEDTFLLANLMQSGELPLFVPSAVVQHSIPLSLLACLRKDLRSAYLEARVFDIIASKGVKIRVSHRQRFSMLWSMWKTSAQSAIGRSAWFVLVTRQGLRQVVFLLYRCFGVRSKFADR
ncbi:MAG TPA: glycosyltransferase family 2 protein [Terriglobales bacterium]|jgi:glycosyltransferase involved in cell wall biosynthesis|nr:glycosyltransferase family 2 protein [Terriglobales bacterium]